eukprot:TRINITY_DN7745_c0_g1_i1.p1 TRINITY_DN7745_c0_g1~~TRINITY_DN7745_c0_g1_i1.p1  ORF type:complete len:289 (-),score=42.63 TRINITY_DN7745_c0_g1_i1:74-940(-)
MPTKQRKPSTVAPSGKASSEHPAEQDGANDNCDDGNERATVRNTPAVSTGSKHMKLLLVVIVAILALGAVVALRQSSAPIQPDPQKVTVPDDVAVSAVQLGLLRRAAEHFNGNRRLDISKVKHATSLHLMGGKPQLAEVSRQLLRPSAFGPAIELHAPDWAVGQGQATALRGAIARALNAARGKGGVKTVVLWTEGVPAGAWEQLKYVLDDSPVPIVVTRTEQVPAQSLIFLLLTDTKKSNDNGEECGTAISADAVRECGARASSRLGLWSDRVNHVLRFHVPLTSKD